MTFTGKTVLVAGGAGDIGRAVCRAFLDGGAAVLCADLSMRRAQAFCAGETTDRAVPFRLDAADPAQWAACCDAAVSRFGRLDILVTAFHSGGAGSVETLDADGWAASFQGTAAGVFHGMAAAARVLGSGGSIVNIASVMAHGRAGGNIAYSSAKAAVIAASRSAALTLAPRGVRVNLVTPGLIDTRSLEPMVQAVRALDARQPELDGYLRRIPLGRLGTAAEVAKAVTFLASDEALYITGAELVVDGGWLCA